jgi:pantoate--beta-alanine ligase
MQIIDTLSQLKSTLDEGRKLQKTIGFIPTMGALHQGHISLVSTSKKENDITVVSIFVNPTQFNDQEDLKNYPRTMESDLEKLKPFDVDIVFAPSVIEMYPEPDHRVFDFGNLDKVMEGKHRPGHFNGVAQIVSKLLIAVEPNRAYFGDKDFQQLTIIKHLVKILPLGVEIIPCPIIRESDGLAMSSRNIRLTPSQRKSSVLISQTLFESKKIGQTLAIDKLIEWVIETINKNSELSVEYFEIVDDVSLMTIHSWDEPNKKVGCIAVKVGPIRLIDNIRYNS